MFKLSPVSSVGSGEDCRPLRKAEVRSLALDFLETGERPRTAIQSQIVWLADMQMSVMIARVYSAGRYGDRLGDKIWKEDGTCSARDSYYLR